MKPSQFILQHLKIVPHDGWQNIMLKIVGDPALFFIEESKDKKKEPLERLSTLIELYNQRNSPESYFQSIDLNSILRFDLTENSNLHQLVETAYDKIPKKPDPDRHKNKITVIFEELAMNGIRSSLKSSKKTSTSLEKTPQSTMYIVCDNSSVWIHSIDNQGSFQRRFLPGSFKDYDGSQGFGMKLIFDNASDLFISCTPKMHTWMAARVPIYLSNLNYDSESKVLCIDAE